MLGAVAAGNRDKKILEIDLKGKDIKRKIYEERPSRTNEGKVNGTRSMKTPSKPKGEEFQSVAGEEEMVNSQATGCIHETGLLWTTPHKNYLQPLKAQETFV
ncbi:hypothetical protein EMPG_12402 [Blastomyces silverae]|uniref:Uncharacterized protein n=1 Tax=Blastomyces silverae TaxID=2060906 RepID=A0A0H1BM28_9EURO|nr:hypothetical protein EMPG_12402 [Blastomyces silverae]